MSELREQEREAETEGRGRAVLMTFHESKATESQWSL